MESDTEMKENNVLVERVVRIVDGLEHMVELSIEVAQLVLLFHLEYKVVT